MLTLDPDHAPPRAGKKVRPASRPVRNRRRESLIFTLVLLVLIPIGLGIDHLTGRLYFSSITFALLLVGASGVWGLEHFFFSKT